MFWINLYYKKDNKHWISNERSHGTSVSAITFTREQWFRWGAGRPRPPVPWKSKNTLCTQKYPQKFSPLRGDFTPKSKKNRLRRFYRTIYTCFSTLCGAVRRPEKKVHVLSPPSVVFVYFYSDLDLQKYIFSRQKEHNIILLKNSACDGPLKLLFRFAEPAPIGRSPAKRKILVNPHLCKRFLSRLRRAKHIFSFYQ